MVGAHTLQFNSSVVFDISLPSDVDSSNEVKDAEGFLCSDWIEADGGGRWLDVHADRSAILMHPTLVRIVDHGCGAEKTTQEKKLREQTDALSHAGQDVDLKAEYDASSGVGINLEHEVVGLAFSNCGGYLAIADLSGALHLYKSSGERLFAYPILKTTEADRIVALKFATHGHLGASTKGQDLIVVTSAGAAFCFGDLNAFEIEQTLARDAENALQSITQRIRLQRVNVGSLDENKRSIVLAHRFRSTVNLIVANHQQPLSMWQIKARGGLDTSTAIQNTSSYSSTPHLLAGVASMEFTHDRKFLIVLSCNGVLSWWDWYDMIVLYQHLKCEIQSFTVLNFPTPRNEVCDTTFVAVSQASKSEEPSSFVEIVKIAHGSAAKPWTYESVWRARESLVHSKQSVIMARMNQGDDAIASFLTVARARGNITMLKWGTKQHFPASSQKVMAACTGTLAHGLTENPDILSVAESLASVPLSSFESGTGFSDFVVQLELCYSMIGRQEDESRAVLALLLDLAQKLRKRVSLVSSAQVATKMMEYCDQISKLSYKWTTFQLLLTSYTEQAEENGASLREKWDLFENADLMGLLESYVRKGAMRPVMILWSRHMNDDMVRNIGSLLHYLPVSLPIAVYKKWVQREVIPAIIKVAETSPPDDPDEGTPLLLLDFAEWLLLRAQTAAERGDIETAIDLCGLMKLSGHSASEDNYSFSYFEFKMQASDRTHPSRAPQGAQLDGHKAKKLNTFSILEKLGEDLRHIKYLADNHQFKISLLLFADETPSTIAMSMLDRVSSPDQLHHEIDYHAKKYLRFCGSQADPVLRDYVTELAESIQTAKSTEEARALVVLNSIDDIEIRADAALALLRSVLPPYSQKLKMFAKSDAMSWGSKRQEEIEEHLRLMEIQDMLMAYGIRQFDIADSRNVSRLLDHILSQISRTSALDDAMRLVDAYSHLHCERAILQFVENMLTFPCGHESKGQVVDLDTEISWRTEKAVIALKHVKKRIDVGTNPLLLISLMEEVIELGLTLIEIEEEKQSAAVQLVTLKFREHDGMRGLEDEASSSFVLSMVAALAAAFLPEIQSLNDAATSTRNEIVSDYVKSSDFALNEKLISDLQKLKRIEAEHRILLSISTLRDPEKIEIKLKQLMKPDILFADDGVPNEQGTSLDSMLAQSSLAIGRGKGKKRAAGWAAEDGMSSTKVPWNAHRLTERGGPEAFCTGTQQDEERAQYTSDLCRLASNIGISPSKYRSILAKSAAQNGSILRAVRFSRDLFSRQCKTKKQGCPKAQDMTPTGRTPTGECESKAMSAETLKSISLAISLFTASHIDDIYSPVRSHNQLPTSSQIARMQAPSYSLELLQYSICVCDIDSFEETFVLLKNASLLNEMLHFTQPDTTSKPLEQDHLRWRIYNRWFRGDACALPSSEAMRLATRFAIAEHKGLVNPESRSDLIASKRFVSFLVENDANLLSLQVLLSMQMLPEDATSVVQAQVQKLISTVFQSQDIDNHFALGLMLTLEQVDAFNSFKRQISRENVAKDFNRFQQLALIGSDAARAWQQIAFLHQCAELEGNARWWHYLNLLGIECDHKAFQSERRDLAHIRRLVPALIVKSNYDFYTVLEFTRHYQIDDNYPSLSYVEALLLKKNASPDDLEYQDKIAGVLEDIHEQHLVALLLKSIPKISGTDYNRLIFVFRVLLENTSYPEKSEVERRIEVLYILKAHTANQARKAATVDEIQDVDNSLGAAVPDQVSFHELIAKPRKLLTQILNQENFGVLFDLAEPLRLQTDELQMLLLKNMVQRYLRPGASGHGNESASIDASPQFEVFHEVLSRLTETENKVTAGEWLAENFPFGEEKLKALEFALASASTDAVEASEQKEEESAEKQTFTGIEAQARLTTKILRLQLELILQKTMIEERSLREPAASVRKKDDILQLVTQPKELFFELYRRYSLLAYEHNSERFHQVANDIAALLRVESNTLRRELVNEWLVKDAVFRISNNESDECIFEPLEGETLQRNDEDFIKRLIYVSVRYVQESPSSIEELFEALIRFAKEVKPRAGVTFRAKLRALRVALRLSQVYQPTVISILRTKYQLKRPDGFIMELFNYARHCSHMIVFEERRVPYDITTLLKTDKDSLVRSLLRQYSVRTPWVLRCASRLLLDFGVESADLWEAVLSNMMQLKMIRSLASVLGPLSTRSFVRSLEDGNKIWEYVLLRPLLRLKHFHSTQFRELDGGLSDFIPSGLTPIDAPSKSQAKEHEKLCFGGFPVEQVRDVLENTVALLQKCPFLDQMDVTAFVIHLRDLRSLAEEDEKAEPILESLDFYSFAVRCAMVIPKPLTRFEALQRIIQAGAYMAVLRELLDTSCFLNREADETGDDDEKEFAEQFRLVQTIFEEAIKRGGYRDILQTPFEQGFVEFVAATGNIDRLLAVLLEEKRIERASSTVELYYEFHPSSHSTTSSATESSIDTNNNRRWGRLESYLASSTSRDLEPFRHDL